MKFNKLFILAALLCLALFVNAKKDRKIRRIEISSEETSTEEVEFFGGNDPRMERVCPCWKTTINGDPRYETPCDCQGMTGFRPSD